MKAKFPQGAIKQITGRCIALRGDDIDTDRIIPARYLKCVSFHALGDQVFADDRIELRGNHPFDINDNKGSSILVVNKNFGCGSSREHAPQALMRWGIRGVIGESFAEIFYGNCLALGIPCAIASHETVNALQETIEKTNKEDWILDVKAQIISNNKNKFHLAIEPGPFEMLTTGKWDVTSQLISRKEKINEIMKKLPYLNNFSN